MLCNCVRKTSIKMREGSTHRIAASNPAAAPSSSNSIGSVSRATGATAQETRNRSTATKSETPLPAWFTRKIQFARCSTGSRKRYLKPDNTKSDNASGAATAAWRKARVAESERCRPGERNRLAKLLQISAAAMATNTVRTSRCRELRASVFPIKVKTAN